MICVVGSSNTDLVVRSLTLPKPGETVLGGEFKMFAGGKGANQAVAAARGGGDVTFVAALGDDNFGREALANFERERIDTQHIKIYHGAASGIALILVDARGENLISVASGANLLLSPDQVEQAEETIAQADYLLMQMETPFVSIERAVQLARQHGTKIILNPAPCPTDGIPDSILSHVDVLIPNGIECCQLGRCKDFDSAAKALLERGVRSMIVTRGAEGVCLYEEGRSLELAAPKVEPTDTVGAGDCFSALLTVGLSEGKPLEEAARFAMVGAAISVTRQGAQTSFPTRAEIDAQSK